MRGVYTNDGVDVRALIEPIDDEFARYFRALGYEVTWDFQRKTGEHWYEIYEGGVLLCQISKKAPLAEFLDDLPHFAEGRRGVGPTDYWIACEDDEKLRAIATRVQEAKP
jgi:hypothetical protein